MEEMSVSVVRSSLVRRVVMGNMPAKWLWSNILISVFVAGYFCLTVSVILGLSIIPFSFFIHILLHKAYASDEMIFAVYSRHIMSEDYFPALSRVHFIQDKYKGI